MTLDQLTSLIRRKESMLCVGLDTDPALIPTHLLQYEDPVFEFNKQIIDATLDIAVAYKPNIAFYEAMGIKGWQALEKTIRYLNLHKEEAFTIADAKRGDIGNTSRMYARAFFEWLDFDSITVAPYMGEDSVTPFLEHQGKWVILLGLTSNNGSKDFQFMENANGKLYEQVIRRAQSWAGADKLMFVVGATHPKELKAIRQIAPEHFFLVPGVGAQGGDVAEICEAGINSRGGLLINSARQIIYAGNGVDFAQKAREAALATREPMKKYVQKNLKGQSIL
jgi:orotidine-5'-phosphate decarboxylase